MRDLQAELTVIAGTKYPDIKPLEERWYQKACAAFNHAFNSDSEMIDNLGRAHTRGSYNIMGVSYQQDYSNVMQKIEGYQISLETAVADLEFTLPEPDLRGMYDSGSTYEFATDLLGLIRAATNEVFVVDPYIDTTLFDLYLGSADPKIAIKLLSSNPAAAVKQVASMFKTSRPQFQFRDSNSIHDRVIFADDRCWVAGQSLKDAAKRKPTYIVEVDSQMVKPPYEAIWSSANILI
jgi:hypothetical protein